MKAKKKPLDVLPAAELGVDIRSGLSVVRVAEPPKRSGGVKLPDIAALLDKLRHEAKVI